MLKIKIEVHKLKTWPQYFEAICSGNKLFEVRKDDRGFKVGDCLMLLEWCPKQEMLTGRFLTCDVTYKLEGGQFGIEQGYCCLGIAPTQNKELTTQPPTNTSGH